MLGLINLVDGSGQAATYLVYSLDQDVELVGLINVPWGTEADVVASPGFQSLDPSIVSLGSEFGNYPLLGLIELRIYL